MWLLEVGGVGFLGGGVGGMEYRLPHTSGVTCWVSPTSHRSILGANHVGASHRRQSCLQAQCLWFNTDVLQTEFLVCRHVLLKRLSVFRGWTTADIKLYRYWEHAVKDNSDCRINQLRQHWLRVLPDSYCHTHAMHIIIQDITNSPSVQNLVCHVLIVICPPPTWKFW